MPSLSKPVQRLMVAILLLDLPCSGTVTHSRGILTTGKSHGKKPDRFVIIPVFIVFNKKYEHVVANFSMKIDSSHSEQDTLKI